MGRSFSWSCDPKSAVGSEPKYKSNFLDMCHVCLIVFNRMSINVKVAEVCILVKSAQKLYIKSASDAEVLLLVNGRTI